jgi:hypothetical protein
MRKSILMLCALLTVGAVGASLLGKPKIVQCDDSELAKVTGGWFTECDGNTPCEVWCHAIDPDLPSWFTYNNGAQTCGSPALENCQNDLKATANAVCFGTLNASLGTATQITTIRGMLAPAELSNLYHIPIHRTH